MTPEERRCLNSPDGVHEPDSRIRCTRCGAIRDETRSPFDVTLHPERLDQPLHWRKPRRVFVCSVSDLFHEAVPIEFIVEVWDRMICSPRHAFQVLTKRPERMRDWLVGVFAKPIMRSIDPLPNIWLGVSIESDRYAYRADLLRETPAAIRFVSAEPLLGPLPSLDLTGIDWLIAGGESGPGARPMDPEWVADLVDRADAAGAKVFVKQDSDLYPGKQGNLPDYLWARKEYPA
jgi:protein gp37